MTRLISEAQFQNTVIEIFQAHGCPVFHIGDSRREIRRRDGTRLLVGDHRARGYPDLTIAGTPDEVIWAELKAEGKYPTPEQREWLDRLPPHRAYVWRPGDLDTVELVAQRGHPPDGRTCWTCRRGGRRQRK